MPRTTRHRAPSRRTFRPPPGGGAGLETGAPVALVGVYGTLKRGHANHAAFLAGFPLVRAGAVRIPFRLFGNEEYPMLIPAPDLNPVVVETYRVDAGTVAKLDAFEGQFGYRREEVVPEGETEPVALYVHPGPPPADFIPAPGGEWNGQPGAFAGALARVRARHG